MSPEDDIRILKASNLIADELNKIMKQRKLSERQVARLAGVGHTTVWRMQNSSPVSLDSIVRVFNALGLDHIDITWR